jgi:hydroxymethylpyrimidine kinase/phosphomethylpyrimidine kinase
MHAAARRLVELGARAALVTGGHLPGEACDVLYSDGRVHELSAPRVPMDGVHGAGCTLSAAIAAGLAAALPLRDAVARAKAYVTRALAAAQPLGHGPRPLNHLVRPVDKTQTSG